MNVHERSRPRGALDFPRLVRVDPSGVRQGEPTACRPASKYAVADRALRREPGGRPPRGSAGPSSPPRRGAAQTPLLGQPAPPSPPPPPPPAGPAPAPPPPARPPPSPRRRSQAPLPSSHTALSDSLPARWSEEESSAARIDSSALCPLRPPGPELIGELGARFP